MREIEYVKNILINSEYDIIIAGGGPAGCAAAIAAARMGVKTLLIESTGALGGMGTNGLVPTWCPFSDGEKVIYKGIAVEVLKKLLERTDFQNQDEVDWVPISSERLKVLYDELVAESGATVLFHTFVCDAKRVDNNVEHIIVSNKKGLTAYKAKVYIDTTGDGDLAAFAGADYEKGGAEGKLQASSMCFKLANVNLEHYIQEMLHGSRKDSVIYDILKSGKYPEITDEHIVCKQTDQGVLGFNAGHLYGIDTEDIIGCSKGIMNGRKMAEKYREALAEYLPSVFANADVVQTATTIGTRESRRIKCEYKLVLDDYVNRRTFPDEIARNCYCVDIHVEEKKVAYSPEERDYICDQYYYEPGESHGIPFRSLIPCGFDNLLVAGRVIDCDRMMYGSIRVMPTCLVTGEAAGTAAVLAVAGEKGIHGIDVQQLQSVLKEHGAYFMT